MADSSFEKNLTELSKMKVADLKAELKQRGLPITGNKNELVERLQLALHGDSSLSLDETTDEILDEDAVLGDEEIDEAEDLIAAAEETKPDSQEESIKRKLPAEESNTGAKKIILNRKNIIEEIKVDTAQKKEEQPEKPDDNSQDEANKKVVKLKEMSELSKNERLEMRAKKFGVAATDVSKKDARAARFNITANNNKNASSITSSAVSADYETLKKRGERFGTNVSNLLQKAELEARKEQRKARFGETKPADKLDSTKVKLVK